MVGTRRGFRRRRLALFVLAMLAASAVQADPSGAARKPEPAVQPAVHPQLRMPTAEQIVILIRSSLLTLNDAIETGNFTVLRDRGAPSFQAANTAARLSDIFQNLGRQGVDLSRIAAIAPKLTEGPAIDASHRLHLAGYFPAHPVAIKFGLIFEASAGRWRLFGISVNPAQKGDAAVRNSLPAGMRPAPPPRSDRQKLDQIEPGRRIASRLRSRRRAGAAAD